MKHYGEKLSAYLHGELSQDESMEIAEHLWLCEDCRAELEEIKFGAELAKSLTQADAPLNVWRKIENRLDEKPGDSFSFFDARILIPTALVFLIAVGVTFFIYSRQNIEFQIAAEQTPKIAENLPSKWNVETISGKPKTENQTIASTGVLAVGETLETDENSKARVAVANIGQVEIEPNSRVQLVNTSPNEHRLSLEKGVLQAKIFAPPRLFIVDTPSAVAVDLGCAYTLEVDEKGDSKLHVTGGFVALERDGLESIVPAGAMAITKKDRGLGTPFAENASEEFRQALYAFDFENGGEKSLKIILKNPKIESSLTLWHLLSRVPKDERENVFNKLASVVQLPEGITKEGVLKLDKEMLTVWRLVIEGKWFESYYGNKLT